MLQAAAAGRRLTLWKLHSWNLQMSSIASSCCPAGAVRHGRPRGSFCREWPGGRGGNRCRIGAVVGHGFLPLPARQQPAAAVAALRRWGSCSLLTVQSGPDPQAMWPRAVGRTTTCRAVRQHWLTVRDPCVSSLESRRCSRRSLQSHTNAFLNGCCHSTRTVVCLAALSSSGSPARVLWSCRRSHLAAERPGAVRRRVGATA